MKTAGPVFFLVALIWLFASCAPTDKRLTQYPVAQDSYPALVKIVDYLQARSYRLVYYISNKEVVVVYEDDSPSTSKRRELYRRRLEKSQADRLVSFINQLPLATLNERYVNPHSKDSLVMWFDFALPNRPRKVIEVRNTYQPQLFQLSERVNSVLPEEFWIRRVKFLVR